MPDYDLHQLVANGIGRVERSCPRAVVTPKEMGYLTGIMCIIGGRGTSVKLGRENVLVLFLDSLQEKSYYIFNKLQRVLVWNKKAA
jgi:hypothetical protein